MSRRRRRRNGLIIKIVLTIAILLIALGFIIFGIRMLNLVIILELQKDIEIRNFSVSSISLTSHILE